MMEHNDRPTILSGEPHSVKPVYHGHSRARHLKKRRGRTLMRLGISFFTMLMLITIVPLSSTFSKYTSQSPEITIPSLTAAKFACDVKDEFTVTDEQKTSTYGLDSSDIILKSFQVCNFKDDITSEVDLSVYVHLELTGKYSYYADFDFSQDPPTIKLEDLVGNKDKAVEDNRYYLEHLQENIKIKVGTLNPDGTFVADVVSDVPAYELPTSDMRLENDLIPIADPAGTLMSPIFNYIYNNSDAVRLSAGTQQTKTVIIYLDGTVNSEEGSPITYTGPEIQLTATTNGRNNFEVTFNQVD